jgi:uncharacterized protein (DUF302 family)
MDISIKATSSHDFDATIERARAELMKEGFGVLTEIDIQAKMQEKLGKEMGRYTILGACNPALAWDALHAVMDLGVLLPCNVCVYEDSDNVIVSAMQPKAALNLIPDDTVHRVGIEAAQRLERAVAAIVA